MILMYKDILPLTWQPQEINHHHRHYFTFDKYALTGQVAELMASKVFLSKTQLLLIIQSPVLLCCGATLQYLQCTGEREAALPLAFCPCAGVRSRRMSHNSICSSSAERGKKLLSSLIKKSTSLWRCTRA